MISLNQKEAALLQDLKKHEELCIKKYGSYAAQATDPQLKQLFTTLGQQEQQHLNSINQILAGQLPTTSGQQGSQQDSQPAQQNKQAFPPIQPTTASPQADAVMCEDLLSTEKYVSGTYNTAIFEFRDPGVRQVLNHIQMEEQEHGLGLYSYMASHGMYQA
jgi:spore coat protein CotF